jgi:hypothetical protein
MTGLFLRKGGWLAVTFLLVALAVSIVWYVLSDSARALNARGVPVTAEVLVLQVDEPLYPRPGNRTTTYEAIVGFTLNGTRHQARQGLSRSFFDTLSPRETITIRVLPDDPSILEIEPGAASGNAGAAFWAALVLWLLGATVATASLRLARRIVRLRKHGVPRTAEVTEVKRIGDKHMLHFRWRDRFGELRQGHTQPRKMADGLAGLAPGDPLPVAEDPDNPARAMWVLDLADTRRPT